MKIYKRLLLFASIIFILAGTLLISLSLSDLNHSEAETENALTEAKEKVRDKEGGTILRKNAIIQYEKGEVIGILEIPGLEAELPIIEGTHEDELEKGVGHYAGSVFPGQEDQIVLSGHRDTVFRRLGELEIGDTLQIVMPYGKYSYKISQSQIVEANDTSIIQSTAPVETLIVSTCYPFSFIGDAPYRYVLTAYREESK
ncbi:class D sortase [Cytobacillus massiliigabonensis]|uniref:class D sortase n=1 Tax=Cytobacillus massiliigabonensis TaxID=1871011 RepID=UPI000C84A4D9|nr:class D sortase [Cytobacillus massiliigabonensis]